ncbi:MAG TPA: FxsA family protein [Salinibacter sp.]|nr:FxsA family protein [Salinibacter sp.]
MLGRLLLLFLLTAAVELALLIQVDKLIGFGPTIGLIIATGIAGSYLARREGLNTWERLNDRLQSGDLPGKELVDGVIILVAGALLVTPGVFTDVVGFIGLLPPTRALIRKALMRRFQSKMKRGSMQVQFGIFGGSPPGPNGGGSQAPSSPDQDDAGGGWEGTGRRIPRHEDGKTSSPSNSR